MTALQDVGVRCLVCVLRSSAAPWELPVRGGVWVVNTPSPTYVYSFMAPFNSRLTHTYSQLLRENEVLQTDHKNLKTLLNNSKLEQTRLEAEFSKLKEQYQQLDITSTKLNNQCEVREHDAVFHDWYLCNIYVVVYL